MITEEKILDKVNDEKVSRRLESIHRFRQKFYSYLEKRGHKSENKRPSKLSSDTLSQVKK